MFRRDSLETIWVLFASTMLIVIVVVIASIILAYPTMCLWNWLMPDIFGLQKIDFFQALGLYILSGLLFRQGSNTDRKS